MLMEDKFAVEKLDRSLQNFHQCLQ